MSSVNWGNSMDFNEKQTEYSKIAKKELPVEITPRYEVSKKNAKEILKRYKELTEADFWILMRESKDLSVMQYLGLIISHNACIKINDKASAADKFDPLSLTLDTKGYSNSLVYTYRNKAQSIFEVGESNRRNCKNGYPYATALKRVFDRVVLRIAKLTYPEIHSEEESWEADAAEQEEEETHSVAETDEIQFSSATDMFQEPSGDSK